MRLEWSPSTRAGLLGTGTMLPSSHAPLAPHVPPPSPTTQNTEGGGVWAEHLRCPPPRASPSVWGRLRACTDVAGRAASGLGGLDPSSRGASRIVGEVPSHRVERAGGVSTKGATLIRGPPPVGYTPSTASGTTRAAPWRRRSCWLALGLSTDNRHECGICDRDSLCGRCQIRLPPPIVAPERG